MEKKGFTYNEKTFDDLFVHGWDQSFADDAESSDSSDENETNDN